MANPYRLRLFENYRFVLYAPFYAAHAIGAYRDEGLEVELLPSPGPGKAEQALCDGAADAMWMGPIRIMKHHDERRRRVVVVMLHKADRTHPQHIDLARRERRLCIPRPGRGQQLDLEPLIGIRAGRMRGIKRRVQNEAVILEQTQAIRLGHR